MFGQGHTAQHIVGATEVALGQNLPGHAFIVEQPGNASAAAGQFVLDAFVVFEVVEGLRSAGPFQVIRAGDHHQGGIFQRSGDQAGIRDGSHANRHVVAFADEIDVAITDVRLDLHRRIARPKFGQQRQNSMMRVGGRNTDAQRTGRHLLLAHHLALGLDQLRKGLATFFVITATTVGQLHTTRGAREQAHTKAFFHARHRTAHGSGGDTRHQRRGSKTAGLGGQAKQLDAAQLKIVELSLHD
ncbi:hypothetical protein D3C71_1521410 [compost metagenome]